MGLQVPHRTAPSAIHGTGLFATQDLLEGTLLWSYNPCLDSRRRLCELEPAEQLILLHYGYVNPLQKEFVVICGDDACFWNFPPVGSAANAIPSQELLYGEALIVAARAIREGEELLIDPSSDADYFRKLSNADLPLMAGAVLSGVS